MPAVKKDIRIFISDESVINKIYFIRGAKVMVDRDLAEMYGVETKRLKEAVKRNIEIFPEDFMFELTKEELQTLRSQFVISKEKRGGTQYLLFAFIAKKRMIGFKSNDE